jgi:hypothetical protein
VGQDAFLGKLGSTGTSLTYLTYLGGSGLETIPAGGIAVDTSGNLYVAGTTHSTDLTTVNPYQSSNRAPSGGSNAFLAKLNPIASPKAQLRGGSGTAKLPASVPSGRRCMTVTAPHCPPAIPRAP